ncbi:hypothetical protein CLOP_g1844, partial [Closterium sp. NIES-67]
PRGCVNLYMSCM